MIDLASRRVVGFAVADHLRTSLVTEAFQMAVTVRRPQSGIVFHSDHGSQYTSRGVYEVARAWCRGLAEPSPASVHQACENAIALIAGAPLTGALQDAATTAASPCRPPHRDGSSHACRASGSLRGWVPVAYPIPPVTATSSAAR